MVAEKIPCPACKRQFTHVAHLAQHQRSTHDNPQWIRDRAKKNTAIVTCQAKAAPTCPTCGNPAQLRPGKFGIKAEYCGLWSWNYKALVGRETHLARIQAHAAFDALWETGKLTRTEAYERLGRAMRMSGEDCHIALMSERQALQVVAIVQSGRLLTEDVS